MVNPKVADQIGQEISPNTFSSLRHVALLIMVLLLTSRTFQYFPGFGVIQELAFIIAPLMFLLMVFSNPRAIGATPGFELYIISIAFIMPFWSALAASYAFGQTLLHGVLAWRGYGLISVSLMLLYALRLRWINLGSIHTALMKCAWITLGLYLVMSFTLEPANFVEYGVGFIEDRGNEGMRFKFNSIFLMYAFFNFLVRARRENRWILYLPAVLIYFYLFGFSGGRTLTVSIIITIAILRSRLSNLLLILRNLGILFLLIFFALSLGWLVAPETTNERIDKFGDAFSVFYVDDYEEIEDSSASNRVLENSIAVKEIEKHPIVGNGRLSAKWTEDGFQGFYGTSFYPDDLGVIGVVFQFGFAGLIIFLLQFAWGFKSIRKIRAQQMTLPVETARAFLIFLAVSSVVTGTFALFPEISLFFIAILVYAGQQHYSLHK